MQFSPLSPACRGNNTDGRTDGQHENNNAQHGAAYTGGTQRHRHKNYKIRVHVHPWACLVIGPPRVGYVTNDDRKTMMMMIRRFT